MPPSRRKGPRPRSSARMIVLTLLGIVCAGLALWVILWMHYYMSMTEEQAATVAEQKAFNFAFKFPPAPWKKDESLQITMTVNLALRRGNPSDATALFFRDYKTRLPSQAEQIDVALTKLRALLKKLEWELKPKDPATLGGQPALRMEFEGDDPGQVRMSGQCLLLAYRGFAYWFFTWGPLEQREQIEPEWDGLRQGFRLLNEREGWTEKPRETEPIQGKKLPYRLDFAKGLWEKVETDGYDPLADLVLIGHEPSAKPKVGDPDDPAPIGPEPGHRHAGRAATLQVLLLPREEDLKAAVKAAHAYVLRRQQAPDGENYPKTTMAPLKDKSGAEEDRDTDIGDVRGHLTRLQVKNTEDRERYVVLGIVNRPEGVVVLMFDCNWTRRDFWEQEFTPLLKTLRFLAR
jgi:hypothetical protein